MRRELRDEDSSRRTLRPSAPRNGSGLEAAVVAAELVAVRGVAVPGLVEFRRVLDLVLVTSDVDLLVIGIDPIDDSGGQHHLFAQNPRARVDDDVARPDPPHRRAPPPDRLATRRNSARVAGGSREAALSGWPTAYRVQAESTSADPSRRGRRRQIASIRDPRGPCRGRAGALGADTEMRPSSGAAR